MSFLKTCFTYSVGSQQGRLHCSTGIRKGDREGGGERGKGMMYNFSEQVSDIKGLESKRDQSSYLLKTEAFPDLYPCSHSQHQYE